MTVEAQRTLCILQPDSAVSRANAKCPTLRLRFPMVGSGGKGGGGGGGVTVRKEQCWYGN